MSTFFSKLCYSMFQVPFDCFHVCPFAYSKHFALFGTSAGHRLGPFPACLSISATLTGRRLTTRTGNPSQRLDWSSFGPVLTSATFIPTNLGAVLRSTIDQNPGPPNPDQDFGKRSFPNSNFRFYCTRRNMICLIMILDF